MAQSFNFLDAENFRPETWFSSENPLFRAVRKNHEFAYETFEKAARANLELTSDLLDLSRKRFNSLYGGNSFGDALAAEREIAVEAGNRLVSWAEQFGEIAGNAQAFCSEAANEWVEPAVKAARPAKAAKAAKTVKAA